MDYVDFKDPGWGNDFPQLVATINYEAKSAEAHVPPCALGAIVKRESEGRNVLQDGKSPGDPETGVGYCQITFGVDWTDPMDPTFRYNDTPYHLWDPASNLFVAAAAFLRPVIDDMQALKNQVGVAMPEQLLFYAFAAYNAGPQKISDVINAGGGKAEVDAATTNNYGSGTYQLYADAVFAAHRA